jgi:ABC-2 type transport system ATP-binding protein
MLLIKSLSKKIKKHQILKNINLEIKQGETFGFLGPNGAGKTTLVKIVLGLMKSSSGELNVNCKKLIKVYFIEKKVDCFLIPSMIFLFTHTFTTWYSFYN